MTTIRARRLARPLAWAAASAVLVTLGAPAVARQGGPAPSTDIPREGTYLYRLLLAQAAPGRYAEFFDLFTREAASLAGGGEEVPVLMRHSQGDHWDLAALYPIGSFAEFHGAPRAARRDAALAEAGLGPRDFLRLLNGVSAWHEEVWVEGPPVASLRAQVRDAGLLHYEMMQPLPGKREALIEERRMENAFNRGRGRGQTLIFTRRAGAAWDVITLGAYRNWQQYAEVEHIPADTADRAAKAAGFAGADLVGAYMRSLISTHRDTLGPRVPADIR